MGRKTGDGRPKSEEDKGRKGEGERGRMGNLKI